MDLAGPRTSVGMALNQTTYRSWQPCQSPRSRAKSKIIQRYLPPPWCFGGAGDISRPNDNEWQRRGSALAETPTGRKHDENATAVEKPDGLRPTSITSTIDKASDQPMLQLVAAWDSLASRLPPSVGNGAHADLLIATLKLVLASAPPEPASRALALASTLAELAGAGLPLDADAIAAGIVSEAFPHGHPYGNDIIEHRLGFRVVALLADLVKVRRLPARIELYDDEAAAALRELCLTFYDVRATAVEVATRLHSLQSGHRNATALPSPVGGAADQQVAALEALQIYAPLGHALGLGSVATQLENLCFQILFPTSYDATSQWLRQQADGNAVTLEGCGAALQAAVAANPAFQRLAGGLDIRGRTKSPFSTLKKILRLGNTAKGGRSRWEVYDLIGLRAVVVPIADHPDGPERAEQLATEACYIVEAAAHALWNPVAGRSKDYIRAPKPNGYQSLHSTVELSSTDQREENGASGTLELQIRTQAMHARAESGEASHTAYKGGLDAAQARQLREWTEILLGAPSHPSWGPFPGGMASILGVPPRHGHIVQPRDTQEAGPYSTAEALFRTLDLNGDGKLSLEELATALAELNQGADFADSLLAAADSNYDGGISLEEFLEFQKRVGLVYGVAAMDQAAAATAAAVLHDHGGDPGSATMNRGLRPLSPIVDLSVDSTSSDDEACDAAAPVNRMVHNSSGASGSRSLLHVWHASPAGSFRGRRGGSTSRLGAFIDRDGGPTSSGSAGGGGNGSSSSSLDEISTTTTPEEGAGEGHAINRSLHPPRRPSDAAVALSSSNGSGSNPTQSNGNGSRALTEKAVTGPSSLSGPGTDHDHDGEDGEDVEMAMEHPATPLHGKPDREAGWNTVHRAVHGFMRIFQSAAVPRLDASWELVPIPHTLGGSLGVKNVIGRRSVPAVEVLHAAGQPINPASTSSTSSAPIALPRHGPCIVGAVRDRDCDLIVDLPTVSGRHARFEVLRRRPDGVSRCIIMDLGSTNGTWVNRAKILPFHKVPVYPGDVVSFAEPGISFEVRASVAAPGENVTHSSSSSSPLVGGYTYTSAVAGALDVATALESEAAARGIFAPPLPRGKVSIGDYARELLAAREYQAAYMLLLGGAMACPNDPALWAQLAGIERQRARRREQGSSIGTVRAFFRAAVERFEAETEDMRVRRRGLARVFSSWAQLEYDVRNDAPARILFQKAVNAARSHPDGPVAAGAAKLLFTWASREWKLGEAALAARLCQEAMDFEPSNAYVLTLMANIKVEADDNVAARHLYEMAARADPSYVTALQCWAKMEAQTGNMHAARRLFKRALRADPENTFVMQAWAVAEYRVGNRSVSRGLLIQCTQKDPRCRAAWHAWARLEESMGDVKRARELYHKVLELKPTSVEALSALGALERASGDSAAATTYLEKALAHDARHAPALNELARVLRAENNDVDAYKLEKKAKRVNQDRRAALAQIKSADGNRD